MPPKQSKKVDNTKSVERVLGRYLTLACYAHSSDIKVNIGDMPPGTNPLLNEYYENFILDKDEKKKLAARFSPGTRVEQILRMVWEAYIADMRDNINIAAGDTFDTIMDKLDEYNNACAAFLVFKIWNKNNGTVRCYPKLISVDDNSKMRAATVNQFQRIAGTDELISIVYNTFAGFMRTFAMNVSAVNWYGKTSIEPLLWGFLIANGAATSNILEWRDGIRPEPERKPKAKKEESAAEHTVEPAAPAVEPMLAADAAAAAVAAVINDALIF